VKGNEGDEEAAQKLGVPGRGGGRATALV